jgi:hypothetical protein
MTNLRERMPQFYMAAASIYAVAGMSVGTYMHMTSWKRPVPFHGHLDSLGFLSLAVIGLYFQVFPKAREHALALAVFWLLQIGVLLMLGGLPIAIFGITRVFVNAGTVFVPLGFLLFCCITLSSLFKKNNDLK